MKLLTYSRRSVVRYGQCLRCPTYVDSEQFIVVVRVDHGDFAARFEGDKQQYAVALECARACDTRIVKIDSSAKGLP